jgi:hypothetical protein
MKKLSLIASSFAVAFMFSCGSEEKVIPDNIQELPTELKQQIESLENYKKVTGGADIYFPETEHDLGNVTKGELVPYSFYFVNNGDAPLLINDAKGSCGCTIPYFSKDPIQPGEKGKIDLTVDTERKTADKVFTVFVTVSSNAKTENVKLKVTGIPVEITE